MTEEVQLCAEVVSIGNLFEEHEDGIYLAAASVQKAGAIIAAVDTEAKQTVLTHLIALAVKFANDGEPHCQIGVLQLCALAGVLMERDMLQVFRAAGIDVDSALKTLGEKRELAPAATTEISNPNSLLSLLANKKP